MTIAYTFMDYLVAWWAMIVLFAWIVIWVGAIQNWFAEKNSPNNSPDILVQQMFAENLNVNRDPTIPVGEYNPKNSAHRR